VYTKYLYYGEIEEKEVYFNVGLSQIYLKKKSEGFLKER